jgi:hypothetical protein
MLNPLILAPVLEVGKSLIDRFFPDQEAKRRAEAEMLTMVAQGELAVVLKQLEVNAVEAAHPSLFVSGGRPAVIWVGVAGLAYATLLHPMLTWLCSIKGWPVPPAVETEVLTTVLFGLLGIGSMRSLEKIKGVASK